MRRPPKTHLAFPGAPRSPRHIGRTYAYCFVWAHDTHVKAFRYVYGRPFIPQGVDCRNCWSRFRRAMTDSKKMVRLLGI